MPYTWTNAEQSSLKYEYNGKTLHIPADPANRHYQKYLASGETPAAHVAPPAPTPLTPQEKLANLNLTKAELVTLVNEGHAASQTVADKNGVDQPMTNEEKIEYMCSHFNLTTAELKAVLGSTPSK